jgi:hypothetical protein
MIKNDSTVKVKVDVKLVHTGEILVKIERWTKDIGWASMDLYFTPDEFEKFVAAVGPARVKSK